MGRLTKRIIPTAIAVAAGFLVLIGYLIPYGILTYIRDQLIRWATIIAAFAFILGFFNVLRVHIERLTRKKQPNLYSAVLIIAALASLTITLFALLTPLTRAAQSSKETLTILSNWWFQSVLSPLQASTAALVAFTLGLAAFRLLRNRRNGGALLFLFSAIIVLVGTLPIPGQIGFWIANVRTWWMAVPVMAGMRGLLIGVGLGTLLIGLRIIFGLDQPHSDL